VPILTAVRDLFRYAYGRLSNPPRQAGLLPDEALPARVVANHSPRVPLVYRRAQPGSATRPASQQES
jgi:hypothetical protein